MAAVITAGTKLFATSPGTLIAISTPDAPTAAMIKIDGLAGVPSIFEYVGAPDEKPADGRSLRHLATETLDGGTVWIRYTVEKS